jgi:hypothetical protein
MSEDDDPLASAMSEANKHIRADRIDVRAERVARAKCRARGIDPDHVGGHDALPAWRLFEKEAHDFVAMFDALVKEMSHGDHDRDHDEGS